MRHLVACPECKRQYDASGIKVGGIFHCICGARVTVPAPRPHDAAVVRCSWCGAPRTKDIKEGDTCPFCGSEFTLHEKDLHTICPACMARVSDKARFCHHCGTPIVPEDQATSETSHACPVCGEEKKLRSRRLGGMNVAIMECVSCGGIWIGSETFQAVLDHARKSALPPKTMGGASAPERDCKKGSQAPQQGPLYRKCVVCGNLMNRMNYGRTSGVIIDLCKEHGVWFDADELESLVRWIRRGGFALSEERKRMEEKEEKKQAAMKKTIEASHDAWDDEKRRIMGIFGEVGDIFLYIFLDIFLDIF